MNGKQLMMEAQAAGCITLADTANWCYFKGKADAFDEINKDLKEVIGEDEPFPRFSEESIKLHEEKLDAKITESN